MELSESVPVRAGPHHVTVSARYLDLQPLKQTNQQLVGQHEPLTTSRASHYAESEPGIWIVPAAAPAAAVQPEGRWAPVLGLVRQPI